MSVTLHVGDCREALATMPDASVDSIVTDPPYELGFMGKTWDSSGIAYDAAMWAECLRVLEPGGHLLAFGGTRTYHRMTVAIEDAGFEIRDSIHWIYGSGFPKSLDVSKAIDKAAGAEREVKPWLTRDRVGVFAKDGGDTTATSGNLQCPQCMKWKFAPDHCVCPRDDGPQTPEAAAWSGWGTALKPAHEPIVVARKPLVGTVAGNVLAHGTGALNIDGCRTPAEADRPTGLKKDGTRSQRVGHEGWDRPWKQGEQRSELCELHGVARCTICLPAAAGRWPANVIFDEAAAAELDESRFFYCAKAGAKERPVGPDGTKHATVKPLSLMRWLVRLVTPPGGTVLDPFAGSGTTLEAAILEGFDSVGIERDPAHAALCAIRVERSGGQWAIPPGWAA